MFLLGNVRKRLGWAVAAAIGAVLVFICGAILAFVVSPQQALEWRRIKNLPQLDIAAYTATDGGEEVAITGRLANNEVLTADGLVAYYREAWQVKPANPEIEGDRPNGSWQTVEQQAPPLSIDISGGTVTTLLASSPEFGGNLHEVFEAGTGLEATDVQAQGELVADGTTRTFGLKDGDLITVVGKKASTGDLIPDRLYGGDRVELVESIRSGARAAFGVGIFMMICAPLVLVIGVLASLFGGRRGGLLNLRRFL